MLDIDLKFHPHLLNDLEVKVTDLEFFMINEMSVSVSHQKVFIFQI